MIGRIRTLKPEWLDDEGLASCSDAARLLSAGLVLLADDHGNGRANLLYLASHVWSYGDAHETLTKASGALGELERIRFVRLYEVGGQRYFSIRNWQKHQKVQHPSKPRVPTPDQAVADPPAVSMATPPPVVLATPSGEPHEVLTPDQGSGIRDQGSGTRITRACAHEPSGADPTPGQPGVDPWVVYEQIRARHGKMPRSRHAGSDRGMSDQQVVDDLWAWCETAGAQRLGVPREQAFRDVLDAFVSWDASELPKTGKPLPESRPLAFLRGMVEEVATLLASGGAATEDDHDDLVRRQQAARAKHEAERAAKRDAVRREREQEPRA